MSDPVAEKEAGPPASTDTPPATEPRKRVYKDFEHDEEKPTRTCLFFPFFPYRVTGNFFSSYSLLFCENRDAFSNPYTSSGADMIAYIQMPMST